MVEPITVVTSNSLGLAKVNSQAPEAAISTMAQSGRIATSMAKVGETQKATAAEKAQVATNFRPRQIKRRYKNFPQPKQRSLGNEDSHVANTDSFWESFGAQRHKPNQGLEGGQISDPWFLATKATKLQQALDPGRQIDLVA